MVAVIFFQNWVKKHINKNYWGLKIFYDWNFLSLYKDISHIRYFILRTLFFKLILDSYLDYSDHSYFDYKLNLGKLLLTYYFHFIFWFVFYSEAVAQRCSVKKVFLGISQNSQENTSARVSFLIKNTSRWLLIKRIKKKVQNDFRIFAESEWTTFSFVHIFLSSFFQYWLSSNEFASKTKFSRNSTAFPII